jgi:mono/diheme cytochrome c family protein
MRTGLRALSIILRAMLLANGVATAMSTVYAGEIPAADSGMPIRKVSAMFQQRCARCHGQDGTGKAQRSSMPELPNFTSVRWQEDHRNAQLVVSILEGKGTQMPAFSDRLTSEDARELANHIRTFAQGGRNGVTTQSTLEFKAQFRDLAEEIERLRKQFHDLAPRK